MSDNSWSRVSVCIVTLNEEANLPRCLESIFPCGEMIVVDSGSTDGTSEIARAHGAKWFTNKWPGFAKQRQFAESRATCDFVLFLDADEWLSAELCAEIPRVLAADNALRRIYSFRRRSEFLGRQIRHGDWKNDRVTRLAPRGSTTWRGEEPHPYLTSDELPTYRCDSTLFHQPYRDLRHFREKNETYARMWAASAHLRETRGGFLVGALHGTWRFVRGYFIKGGLLDGLAGYVIAREYARNVIRKYAYLTKLHSGESIGRSG